MATALYYGLYMDIDRHRTAIIGSKPCDPNMLGVTGDFVIQVDRNHQVYQGLYKMGL